MRFHRLCDGVALFLLAGITVFAGGAYLDQWDKLLACDQSAGIWMLEPAAMMACGKGFSLPGTPEAPGLAAFLNREVPTFSPADLPEDFSVHPPPSFHRRHLYGIAALGLVWQLFGLSWAPIEVFLLALLLLTGVLAYGLFRQAMGPFLSFGGSTLYVTAPSMLEILPWYRDFAKAPFFLACLLVLSLLLARKVPRWWYFSAAVLLGALIGLGIGFRHDVLICLPPSLCIVALCPRREAELALGERLVAVALLTASFALVSAPVRQSYDETGAPSHDVLMGYEMSHDLSLGLEAASYERVNFFGDWYVLAGTTAYARRVHGNRDLIGNHTSAYDEAGKKRILDMARQFPADMLTRWYAAVLGTLGNAGFDGPSYLPEETPLVGTAVQLRNRLRHPLWWLGLLSAALFFLMAAAQNLHRAGLVFFLVFYFGGYTSIAHEHRHFFHMCFIPLFFAGSVLHYIPSTLLSLLRAVPERGRGAERRMPSPWSSPGVRRACGAAVGTTVVLLLPLYGLRLYQERTVGALLKQYKEAQLEPISAESQILGDWAYYRPTEPLARHAGAFFDCTGTSRLHTYNAWGDFLVAEFKSAPEARTCRVNYQSAIPGSDFSWTARLRPSGSDGQGISRFFFPVYDQPSIADTTTQGWFDGLAVPREYADEFLGLYRVRNQDEFGLWLNLWVPADQTLFRPFQSLQLRKPRPPSWWPEIPPIPPVWTGEGLADDGESRDSDQGRRATLAHLCREDPMAVGIRLALARKCEESGDIAAAIDTYGEAIALAPHLSSPHEELDALLTEQKNPEARIEEWQRVISKGDQSGNARFCLARALAEQGNLAGALAAYEQAAERNKEAPAIPWAIGGVLAKQGKLDNALEAYEKALRLSPFDPFLLYKDMAVALAAQGRATEATALYCAAMDRDGAATILEEVEAPKLLSARSGKKDALMAEREADKAVAKYAQAYATVRAGSKTRTRYAHALQVRAMIAHQRGNAAAALENYRQALTLEPINADLKLREIAVLKDCGDRQGLMTAYRQAIELQPSNGKLYEALSDLYISQNDTEGLLPEWRNAVQEHPDRALAHFFLGVACERNDDLEGAIGAYYKAHALDPASQGRTAKVLHKSACLLEQEGELQKALDTCMQSLTLNPGNVKALSTQARLSAKLNDVPQAKRLYRKAIALQPANYRPYEALSELYVTRGDLDGLVAEWHKAAQNHPDNPLAHFCLGVACERTNNVDGAVDAYARAHVLAPTTQATRERYAKVLEEKAQILEAQGKSGHANELREQARELTAKLFDTPSNK